MCHYAAADHKGGLAESELTKGLLSQFIEMSKEFRGARVGRRVKAVRRPLLDFLR